MQTLSWAQASNPDAPRAWQWVGAVSIPKYGNARIWQRIQGRVEGLQWIPGRFRALSVPGREKSQPAVVLEGRYARTNEQGKWNLVFGKKPIRIRSPLGDFQLPIALRGKVTSVELTAIGPRGEVQTEKLAIILQNGAAFPQTLRSSKAEASTRTSFLQTGLGVSAYSYRQSRVKDFSQLALTLKLGYQSTLFSPRWDFGVGGYLTVYPITTSRKDISAQFLGLNLRFGYIVPGMPPSWSLSLLCGVYYATMFVTNRAFGYGGLAGPQLFPSLRKQLRSGDSLAAYLKYSPVSEGFGLLSLNNREIAAGTSWSHPLRSGHPIAVTLDLANLSYQEPQVNISSTSVSLGISYGW